MSLSAEITPSAKEAAAADFDALLSMRSDPENIRWSGYARAPEAMAFRKWFDGKIADRSGRLFIGFAGRDPVGYVNFTRYVDHEPFDVAYGIAPAHRGRGICAALLIDSIDRMMDLDFSSPSFNAWIAAENIASEHAARKAGFSLTATLKYQAMKFPDHRLKTMHLWMQSRHPQGPLRTARK